MHWRLVWRSSRRADGCGELWIAAVARCHRGRGADGCGGGGEDGLPVRHTGAHRVRSGGKQTGTTSGRPFVAPPHRPQADTCTARRRLRQAGCSSPYGGARADAYSGCIGRGQSQVCSVLPHSVSVGYGLWREADRIGSRMHRAHVSCTGRYRAERSAAWSRPPALVTGFACGQWGSWYVLPAREWRAPEATKGLSPSPHAHPLLAAAGCSSAVSPLLNALCPRLLHLLGVVLRRSGRAVVGRRNGASLRSIAGARAH